MCARCHSPEAKVAGEARVEAVEAARAPFDDRFLAALYEVLMAQGEAAAAALETEGLDAAEAAVDALAEDVEAVYAVLYAEVFAAFAERVADEYTPGKSRTPRVRKEARDLWIEAALAWLREHGGVLITAVQETTRLAIRSLVAAGIREGLGMRQIASGIREAWPEVAAYRAERIARTEVARASSVGTMAGARTLRDEHGFEMEKVWLATRDARTRITHAEADGQRRALDEPFVVGGWEADYPGDPALPPEESVQCRCTVFLEVVS